MQLLFELARQIDEHSQYKTVLHELNKQQQDPRIKLVRQIIQENVHRKLSCADVAEYMHLSVRQLDRIIQGDQSMSLHALIEQIKLTAAQNMLLETDMSISEIAEALGYSNEYNFIRFFSRVEGMSPGRFRNSHHFAIFRRSKPVDNQPD